MSLIHILGFGGIAVLIYLVTGVPVISGALLGTALGFLCAWLLSSPDAGGPLSAYGVFVLCILLGIAGTPQGAKGSSGSWVRSGSYGGKGG